MSYAVAYAALGTAYGLTPAECDEIWDRVKGDPPVSVSPSDEIARFEDTARECGIDLSTASRRRLQPAADVLRDTYPLLDSAADLAAFTVHGAINALAWALTHDQKEEA
jgi:hypothetical protein